MKAISIYTLTSALHDENAVGQMTADFLSQLHIEHDYKHNDYSDYGTAPLSLIFVRTGGTENLFKSLLPLLCRQAPHPIYLLAAPVNNSLAASMEMLSYLRQQGIDGEILHGAPDGLGKRITALAQMAQAQRRLRGARLGVVGRPSDWLIASHADAQAINDRLGVTLVDIDIKELLEIYRDTGLNVNQSTEHAAPSCSLEVAAAMPDARRLHVALSRLVDRHHLAGLTIRCFDLLDTIHNTGCLALALLNASGIVAGCEGDIPAALTMMISQALLGVTGFQANPSAIDRASRSITLAHCTVPLNMVQSYEFDTHFESGIGVGIRGYLPKGDATLFKVSGDLQRAFLAHGVITDNTSYPGLCRTQVRITLDSPDPIDNYFLTSPIGNHHIVIPGHHQQLLSEFVKNIR